MGKIVKRCMGVVILFILLMASKAIVHSHQIGDVIGKLENTDQSYMAIVQKTSYQNIIQTNLVNTKAYFCFEDLVLCGHAKQEETKNKDGLRSDVVDIDDCITEINKLEAIESENLTISHESLAYMKSEFTQSEIVDLINQYKTSFPDRDAYKLLRETIEKTYREVVANAFNKGQARDLLITAVGAETGGIAKTEMTVTDQIPDWAPSHHFNSGEQRSQKLNANDKVNITHSDFNAIINGVSMKKYFCELLFWIIQKLYGGIAQ